MKFLTIGFLSRFYTSYTVMLHVLERINDTEFVSFMFEMVAAMKHSGVNFSFSIIETVSVRSQATAVYVSITEDSIAITVLIG